jgi:hypothetical protein
LSLDGWGNGSKNSAGGYVGVYVVWMEDQSDGKWMVE